MNFYLKLWIDLWLWKVVLNWFQAAIFWKLYLTYQIHHFRYQDQSLLIHLTKPDLFPWLYHQVIFELYLAKVYFLDRHQAFSQLIIWFSLKLFFIFISLCFLLNYPSFGHSISFFCVGSRDYIFCQKSIRGKCSLTKSYLNWKLTVWGSFHLYSKRLNFRSVTFFQVNKILRFSKLLKSLHQINLRYWVSEAHLEQ